MFKNDCRRKPGRSKRWGSADFNETFSDERLSKLIMNCGIKSFEEVLFCEIDHPPRFWTEIGLRYAKLLGKIRAPKKVQSLLQSNFSQFIFEIYPFMNTSVGFETNRAIFTTLTLTSIMPRNTLQILSKNPSTSNSIFSKVREWIFPKHTFPETLMIGFQQTKKLQLVSIFNRTHEAVEFVYFCTLKLRDRR